MSNTFRGLMSNILRRKVFVSWKKKKRSENKHYFLRYILGPTISVYIGLFLEEFVCWSMVWARKNMKVLCFDVMSSFPSHKKAFDPPPNHKFVFPKACKVNGNTKICGRPKIVGFALKGSPRCSKSDRGPAAPVEVSRGGHRRRNQWQYSGPPIIDDLIRRSDLRCSRPFPQPAKCHFHCLSVARPKGRGALTMPGPVDPRKQRKRCGPVKKWRIKWSIAVPAHLVYFGSGKTGSRK